jgi:hypothetical protein
MLLHIVVGFFTARIISTSSAALVKARLVALALGVF